jgi:hypothetical protein
MCVDVCVGWVCGCGWMVVDGWVCGGGVGVRCVGVDGWVGGGGGGWVDGWMGALSNLSPT